MTSLVFFLAALLLFAVAGLISAMESAFASAPRADVDDAARNGRRGAPGVVWVLDRPDAQRNVFAFSRVLFETGAAVFLAFGFGEVFDNVGLALVVAILASAVLTFVLVGVSPRRAGFDNALPLAFALAPFARVLFAVFGPVARLLSWFGSRVAVGARSRGPLGTVDQLRDLVERAEDNDVIEDDEARMIRSVIDLGQTTTREIMVPRTDVVSIGADRSLDKALALFLRTGFSRVPVVGVGGDDEVVGVLYLKDVVRRLHTGTADTELVTEVAREAAFVPDSKRIDDLLEDMQAGHRHAAIVVDEYGGTAGFVTIEDIIEEIVGEIDDEYDQVSDEPVQVLAEPPTWRVPSRMDLDDLAELIEVRIPEDEVTSVGGWLAKLLHRVPIAGAVAESGGIRLTAQPGTGRRKRITHIEVAVLDAAAARATSEEHRD